jgi:glycosyltransferase involved in cell wall biosynthesis
LRTVLFFRRLRGLTGGHLKVRDYFGHTLASGDHTARIVFTADSVWTDENPWRDVRDCVVASRDAVKPDVLFVAGLDWEFLTPEERSKSAVPVINLVQGVRHADADDPRRAMLAHRAIRICVGREVADAIRAAGPPNGPVVVIPNAADIADAPPAAARDVDVVVAGSKQPELARRVAARLRAPGRSVDLLDARLPRREFLGRLARAKTAVLLPLAAEGFYLPALEAMALGALVVVPDAVGNREFCADRVNCLMPEFAEEAILAAANAALEMPAARRGAMIAQAAATAARHGPDEERRAFLELLRQAPRLW